MLRNVNKLVNLLCFAVVKGPGIRKIKTGRMYATSFLGSLSTNINRSLGG